MAQQLIESLADATSSPSKYKDEYREKVLELIEAQGRRARRSPSQPEAPAPAKVPGPDGRAGGEPGRGPRPTTTSPSARAPSRPSREGQGRRPKASAVDVLRRVHELEPLGHARDLEHALNRLRAAHEHEPALALLQAPLRAITIAAARSSPGSRARAGRARRRRRPARRASRSSSGSSSPRREQVELAAQRDDRDRAAHRSRSRTSTRRKPKPDGAAGRLGRWRGCAAPTAPAPGSPAGGRGAASPTRRRRRARRRRRGARAHPRARHPAGLARRLDLPVPERPPAGDRASTPRAASSTATTTPGAPAATRRSSTT